MYVLLGSSSKKRVRGSTRGIGFQKKLERGENIEIIISEGRIVGNFSSNFKSEIGIVIRDHAPFKFRLWGDIPEENK